MNYQKWSSNNPFGIMIFLYLLIAMVVAIQNTFIDFGIINGTSSLTWIRIHFITLGVMTQLIYGYIPSFLGATKYRFDIWASLNVGIFSFFYGRSILNNVAMWFGGLSLFLSTILFSIQVFHLKEISNYNTSHFYIGGAFYLIIGIIVGLGIWIGYNDTLLIATPLEVHIHLNNWGFMALVFTGIIIELLPELAGLDENPLLEKSKRIFYLQFFGAFGLVLGPWIPSTPIVVIGMILYIVGSVMMLKIFISTFKDKEKSVGLLHLFFSYVWIFLPLTVAPFVIFKIPGFRYVESMAPQALIYGWVLQVGFSLIPYFLSGREKLGGTKTSVISVNLGGFLLWISIFSNNYRDFIHGMAYALWAISLVSMVIQVHREFIIPDQENTSANKIPI